MMKKMHTISSPDGTQKRSEQQSLDVVHDPDTGTHSPGGVPAGNPHRNWPSG
jgi:hypothetical protein